MVLVSGGITQPLVKIYTSAGVQQAVFIWDKGRIEAMGWTSQEDLMIVEQSGEVTTHTAVRSCLRMKGALPAKSISAHALVGVDNTLVDRCIVNEGRYVVLYST